MKRREFITALGGAAAVMPLASRAQRMTIPRIGILLFAGPDLMGPFPEALRDLGYVEGKTIQIETRSAEGGGVGWVECNETHLLAAPKGDGYRCTQPILRASTGLAGRSK